MLTVKVGLAEFERDPTRTRTGEGRARRGERCEASQKADSDVSSAARGDQAHQCGQGNAFGEIARSYNVSRWTISRLGP
jgi:hypothetical protein